MERIYLDHAATTPLLQDVRQAMAPWQGDEFGNPSSLYEEGRRSRAAIDEARETISSILGCLFAEVIFTSSGTEAANLAIVGAALANPDPVRNRVLLGAAEHHCVLNTRLLLERLSYRVELIPVDRIARIRLDALESMIGPDVLLVSVMSANNELGTLQPVAEAAALSHRYGAIFHCDAVQTLGVSTPGSLVDDLGCELATFSAHKVGGPKGVGAIYLRAGTKVQPLAVGGGQEREMRAGTENVACIVGFAAALRNAQTFDPAARDRFLDGLIAAGFVPTVPDRSKTLLGHAHVRLPGISAETMLIRLDRAGVSASSGAACSSGSLEPSHVLLACGRSEKEAREGLRFTFGRETTLEDADEAARRVIEAGVALKH